MNSETYEKQIIFRKTDIKSVRFLTKWINDGFHFEIRRMEDLCTGAAYCQIMHKLFPYAISLKNVNFTADNQRDYELNFDCLRKCFDRLEIDKTVPVILELARGHLEFASWMYKFHEVNDPGIEYNARKERELAHPMTALKRPISKMSRSHTVLDRQIKFSKPRESAALRSHSVLSTLVRRMPTIPAMPTIPTMPTVPTIPTMPTIPAVPEIPTMPTIPTVPTTPTTPTIPTIPTMPTIPTIPEVPTVSTADVEYRPTKQLGNSKGFYEECMLVPLPGSDSENEADQETGSGMATEIVTGIATESANNSIKRFEDMKDLLDRQEKFAKRSLRMINKVNIDDFNKYELKSEEAQLAEITEKYESMQRIAFKHSDNLIKTVLRIQSKVFESSARMEFKESVGLNNH